MSVRQEKIRFKVSTPNGHTFILKWVRKKDASPCGLLFCAKSYLLFPSWELLCECVNLKEVQDCINRHFGYSAVCQRI